MRNKKKTKVVKSRWMLIVLAPFLGKEERFRSPFKKGANKTTPKPLLKSPIRGFSLKSLLLGPFIRNNKSHHHYANPFSPKKRAFADIIVSPFKHKRKKGSQINENFIASYIKYRSIVKKEQKRTVEFRKSIEKKSFIRWVLSIRIKSFSNYIKSSIISLKNWFNHSRKVLRHRATRYKLLLITINSFLLFILSYILTYVLYQMATVTVGSHFGLYCKLYYYSIIWPPPSSKLWDFDSVITTFLSGPIFSFFIGGLFVILFFLIHEKNRALRTFFLWGYLHAFNFFFSSFLVGSISDQGIGYALKWLYFSTFDKIFSSILGIFVLALIGLTATNSFFKLAPMNFFLRRQNRKLYIMFTVIIPWIFGTLFLILLKTPNNMPYETLLFIPLVFAFIPIFPSSNSRYSARVKIIHENKITKINWNVIVIVTCFILAFRIGLGIGILFDL